MLFSRMVARRKPVIREIARKSVIDKTAIGTDADTVMPTFNTRYKDDAPKMIPRNAPTNTADQVNSGRIFSSGMYGKNPAGAFSFSIGMGRIPVLASRCPPRVLLVGEESGVREFPFVISMMDRAEQGKSRPEKCE